MNDRGEEREGMHKQDGKMAIYEEETNEGEEMERKK
jgi:hypothetical protein